MRRQHIFRDPTANRATSPIEIKKILGRLTPTEVSVLRMTAEGHSAATVAHALGLSERAVEAQLARARLRLRSSGVRNDVDKLRAADVGQARQAAPLLIGHCAQCHARFELSSPGPMRGGRPRRFCSNACRQTAYRKRRAAIEATPQEILPKPQRVRTRLSVCQAHTGGDYGDRCLLFPGHKGPHRTLVDIGSTPRWASWQAAPSASDEDRPRWEAPTTCELHPVCTAAPDLPSWCLLPEDHTGTHAFSEPPAFKQQVLSGDIANALRVRISLR
ncbi:helix-turn-helix transcriptional regulator [Streptomyces sp. NPDC003737]|uniref:helix-turn-helix domain-containing protein n=1 Tax=Streptomyces sp. NPDC003737 TaxID=3364685 RepID=UPI0036874E73